MILFFYDQILRLARLYKKMYVTKEMLEKLYEIYKLDFDLYTLVSLDIGK